MDGQQNQGVLGSAGFRPSAVGVKLWFAQRGMGTLFYFFKCAQRPCFFTKPFARRPFVAVSKSTSLKGAPLRESKPMPKPRRRRGSWKCWHPIAANLSGLQHSYSNRRFARHEPHCNNMGLGWKTKPARQGERCRFLFCFCFFEGGGVG